jgi:hypothetical protein
MSGYNQAARIRNFCAKQACPNKCNNGLQYIDTVCSDPLAIGTNCCNTYKVYIDRYIGSTVDSAARVSLYAGPGAGVDAGKLIGYTASSSTNIYKDQQKTVVVGSLLSSYEALYNAPVANTTNIYTYTGMAKVTASFSIMFIENYTSTTGVFKASANAQLEYCQTVNDAPGPKTLSLYCKSYATNGNLLRKKVNAHFKADSMDIVNDPMQEITLTLSDDI